MLTYTGPSHIIYNTTANCVKGLYKTHATKYYISCSEEGYKDPGLDSWTPVEVRPGDQPPYTIIKTKTESIIYCLYHQIQLEGKMRLCPAYPFRVPIHTRFQVVNVTHEVSYRYSQLTERNNVLKTSIFKEDKDESYERELTLMNTLRLKHNERSQAVTHQESRSYTAEEATLILTTAAAVITIIGFIARMFWPRNSNSEPHGENQTVTVNVTEHEPPSHNEDKIYYPTVPTYSQARWPRAPSPIYANPSTVQVLRGSVEVVKPDSAGGPRV